MSATTADPMSEKRKDYLSWDDYFMAVAFLSAMRSKDPSSQVGACIVNAEKKIVGIGYNGMPNGIDDDEISWARTGASPLDTKYPYVCHAELNAILNKNSASAAGCTLYVALFPCNECAKLIIQSGITEVKYVSDKYHDKIPFIASRRLLEMAKVKISQYVPSRRSVLIDFSCIGTVPSRTPRPGSAATTASASNSATSAAAPVSRAAPPSRTSHGVVSPPSAPAAAAAGMAVTQVVVQPATPETTPKRAHSKAATPAAGAPASPVTPPPPRPATTTAPGAVASPSQAEGPAADATAQEEGACNLM